ncbi:MAG TPA: response regulator [Methylobacter sp.]|jgi:DNA-binding NtrC family response regulator
MRATKVLCIDDEPTILNVVQRILLLEPDNYHVETSLRVSTVIPSFKSGASYDAILCDILMPDMNGVDFYKFIIDNRPELYNKLIFMTGGVMIPGIDVFLSSINCPILEKPFHTEDLISIVKRVVERT